MRIILTGPKGSGKSTIGQRISEMLKIPFLETDMFIEELYFRESGEKLSCRMIYGRMGEIGFRSLEKRAVSELTDRKWCLISTGGGTLFDPELRKNLFKDSLVILLKASDELLWDRIRKGGVPSFLDGVDGFEKNIIRNKKLYECVEHLSDIVFDILSENESEAHDLIAEQILQHFMLRMNSPSSFGEIIRTMTFGESHGPAVGAVLDGIMPGIEISDEDIQGELDRRKPGQSSVTTPRNESDRIHILSGIFEGKTTGSPICMLVYNKDQDSSKYDMLRDVFRPGHADFTFWKKYGIRDHRGGGRSSGRETVGRVAAGAIARKILEDKGILITAFAQEIAGIRGETEQLSEVEKNPVRAADPEKALQMVEAVHKAMNEGDSVGGIVKLIIRKVPPGIGDPVFYKLDSRLAMAVFSIGAVKGVEFGAGFESAEKKGSENNDLMQNGDFLSNNAGGILGGISTGEDIVMRIAVKPTPSISKDQDTVDINGLNQTISVRGRHDPCIVPRIIPVVEAMASLVILDALEIDSRINQYRS